MAQRTGAAVPPTRWPRQPLVPAPSRRRRRLPQNTAVSCRHSRPTYLSRRPVRRHPRLLPKTHKVRRSRRTVMSPGFPYTLAAPISGRLPRCCQKHTKSASSHSATVPLIFMGSPAPYAKAPLHAHTRSPYIPAASHTHPQSPYICIPSISTPRPPRPARSCGMPAQAHPVAGTERRTYSRTHPVTAPASRHRATRRCMPAVGRGSYVSCGPGSRSPGNVGATNPAVP